MSFTEWFGRFKLNIDINRIGRYNFFARTKEEIKNLSPNKTLQLREEWQSWKDKNNIKFIEDNKNNIPYLTQNIDSSESLRSLDEVDLFMNMNEKQRKEWLKKELNAGNPVQMNLFNKLNSLFEALNFIVKY